MRDESTDPIGIGSAVQERDRLESNACHANQRTDIAKVTAATRAKKGARPPQ